MPEVKTLSKKKKKLIFYLSLQKTYLVLNIKDNYDRC